MKLHLDKWLKFPRRQSDGQRSPASHAQQAQQGQPSAGTQQMGGGLPAAWTDPAGLPDPLRMVTGLVWGSAGGLSPLERWFGDFSPLAFEPRVDVVDEGDAIRIAAELPGMERNDVEITVEDDYIVLSGEKKVEKKAEEKGVYRVERAFGRFQRVIPMPDGVDPARADAKFDNGMLTIRIPKVAAKENGRRLEIGGSAPARQGSSTQPSRASAPQQG
jgi:HSP20 family protein